MNSCSFRCCFKRTFSTYLTVALMIAAYGILLLAMKFKDIMNQKLFTVDIGIKQAFSLWPISHLVFYYILGILFPNCHIFLILVGIAWEAFEQIFGLIIDFFMPERVKDKEDKSAYYKRWMSGSIVDIIMNIIGLYLGVASRVVYDKIKGSPPPKCCS